MIRFRDRLALHGTEGGMTIVEVVVALVVFAIMATGIAAGTMSITRITADSRSREIATNLALQELDAARAVPDVSDITSTGTSTDNPAETDVVSGRVYTITRTASWVGTTGTDVKCGSNDNFQYRRVSVTVSWAGQLGTTKNVKSATLIAPRSRYTDTGTGAISVRVIGVDGTARSGVSVAITPVAGGTGEALDKQPDPTNADGCSYATQVTPGTYRIALSKSGYIDSNQNETPSIEQATVVAGSTYGWPAEYDKEGTFTTSYAANYTGGGTVQLPSDLDTTFIPAQGAYAIHLEQTRKSAVKLYPAASGYAAVAGTSADATRKPKCTAMDPVAWTQKKTNGVTLAGVRATATAPVGGSATFSTSASQLSIPMGVVRVSPGALGGYISARSVNQTSDGNPGCSTSTTYSFGTFVSPLASTYIALPYGSWTIYSSSLFGLFDFTVAKSGLTVQTNYDNSSAVTSDGSSVVTTLDPRLPQ